MIPKHLHIVLYKPPSVTLPVLLWYVHGYIHSTHIFSTDVVIT